MDSRVVEDSVVVVLVVCCAIAGNAKATAKVTAVSWIDERFI